MDFEPSELAREYLGRLSEFMQAHVHPNEAYAPVRDHRPLFAEEHGTSWTPAPLLKALATEGKTFVDFDLVS